MGGTPAGPLARTTNFECRRRRILDPPDGTVDAPGDQQGGIDSGPPAGDGRQQQLPIRIFIPAGMLTRATFCLGLKANSNLRRLVT